MYVYNKGDVECLLDYIDNKVFFKIKHIISNGKFY